MRISLLFLSSLAFAPHALGRDMALVIGGGGVIQQPRDIVQLGFIEAGAKATAVLKAKGFSVRTVFDGDDAKTKKAFVDAGSASVLPLTLENLAAELNAIKTAGLSTGDRVVLQFSSHSLPRFLKEKTHVVLTSDPRKGYSLDNLNALLRDLESAGVKVLLLDTGCYSGVTTALAGPGVCIVSAANSFNRASMAGQKMLYKIKGKTEEKIDRVDSLGNAFWSVVAEEAKKAQPLSAEAAFLKARTRHVPMEKMTLTGGENVWARDLPEISTAIHGVLRSFVDRYFGNYHHVRNRKYFQDRTKVLAMQASGPLAPLLAVAEKGMHDRLSDIIASFNEMDAILDDLQEVLAGLDDIEWKPVANLEGGGGASFHLCYALMTGTRESESYSEAIRNACQSQTGRENMAKLVDQYKSLMERNEKDVRALDRVGASLTERERRVYLQLYQELSVQAPATEAEACREFAL